jgi:hypothetical protein
MTQLIHFEQFSEELRYMYPQANTIWATENPLEFVVDGSPVALAGLLATHQPTWLSASPSSIPADGNAFSVVRVNSPVQPGQVLQIRFSQENQTWMEEVTLDPSGKGEIEIATETAGEIIVEVMDTPVHLTIQAYSS